MMSSLIVEQYSILLSMTYPLGTPLHYGHPVSATLNSIRTLSSHTPTVANFATPVKWVRARSAYVLRIKGTAYHAEAGTAEGPEN